MKATKSADLLQDAVRHMNDGKYSRAFALLKDLLKKDPSHQEGRRLLASLLLKFGNLATARGAFDALVKEAIQRKDYPEAEALLREYLASGPRCVPFLEQLGHVYELKGDPYAAVFEYEKAVDVLLDDPDPDRPAYAHELYAKITQLAPSSFVANRVAARFKQMPSKAEPVDSEAPLAAVHDAHPDVEPADVAPPEAASSSAAVITEPEQERKQEEEAGSGLPEDGSEASAATPMNDIEQAVVQTAIPQVVSVVRDRNEEEVPFPPVNQPLRFQEPVDENANDDEQADEHAASEEEPRQEEPSLVEPVDVEEPPGEPHQQPVTLHEAPEAQQESRIVQESHIIPPHEQEVSHPEVQVAEREFSEPPPSVPGKEPEPAAATPITTEPVPEVCSSAVPLLPLGRHADSTWDSTASVPALPERGASRDTQDLSDPIAPTPVVHSAAHADIRMAEPARPVQEAPPMAPTAPTVREAAPKPKRRKARRKLGRGVSTWVSTRVSIIARKARSFTNSVTKLTIFLCLGAIGAVILLLVAAAVGWLMLDQRPSERFTSLDQVSMPKALDDPKRNGYILMLGVDAEDVVDALQAGYLRWLGTKKESDEGCYDLTPSGQPVVPVPVRMQTPAGWMRSADPVAQFTAEAGRVKGEIDPHGVLLTRYKQWLGLPFEDWGFGNSNVPYCGLFLGIHRLYLADGFVQSLNAGLERLESDLTAWRNVLSKATTLSTKVMAVEGLNDDVAIMSGLLTRPSVDIKVLQRISRLAKPLQEEDRALRWPLQHEFRETIKRMDGRLRSHEEDHQAFTAWIAARLPVPKQRVLNDYADYYDAWLKIDAAPNAPPPNFHDFAHTPAQSVADYVVNPIDNVIGRERVVDWEAARGMVLETDARLRLTGLVTRLRSGTGSNMATLVAQAGHTLYDPFTELPMLINMSERKVYSVGRNRKDDGGNPASDVALKFLP